MTYMILTNGDKGNHNPEITRNQLIAMRKIEQRRSAEAMRREAGALYGRGGRLSPADARYSQGVTREIRRIRPELIICPHPDRYLVGDGYINHPDHRNAGLIALEAIFPAADNPMFYPDMMDEGYLPHKISQLYVSGHDEPNIEVDISADAERKVAAILCHVSQFDEPEKAADSWRKRWSETGPDGEPQVFERFKCMKFG